LNKIKEYSDFEIRKDLDFTLFHNPNQENSISATAISEWTGQDENSIVANANFIAPLEGDFNVKEALAKKIGFKNIPTTGFGVTSEHLKLTAPEAEIILPNKYFNNTLSK